ncbi:hypothetical protein MSIMFB_00364 [Mycobacterium simulans]|uniref:Uncharacterized protein n=1 Tax=Mycobacterium simulans TaxID=627089 RepID=A0A7Z7IHJ9_9MYCO|nr:hypothetical protein MSIMFB_00364 [Mycobacterium simulans]
MAANQFRTSGDDIAANGEAVRSASAPSAAISPHLGHPATAVGEGWKNLYKKPDKSVIFGQIMGRRVPPLRHCVPSATEFSV